MDYSLNEMEARILGVLVEKQMTTPEYYPLTLNALRNGCNQKSNRPPVTNWSEAEVNEAIQHLREKHLVWQVKTPGSRVAKFEHNMKEVADLSSGELGLLCTLLLRGPQTVGELKTRTARMVEFHGLAAVEHTLQKLMNHESGPFVEKQMPRPGQKENRYAQLFYVGGETEPELDSMASPPENPMDGAESDPLRLLKERVEILEAELQDLKAGFIQFKKQFE
jgi:uncharacterized protein YceH (UPF0502 family)